MLLAQGGDQAGTVWALRTIATTTEKTGGTTAMAVAESAAAAAMAVTAAATARAHVGMLAASTHATAETTRTGAPRDHLTIVIAGAPPVTAPEARLLRMQQGRPLSQLARTRRHST
jgi:hypothetical protein